MWWALLFVAVCIILTLMFTRDRHNDVKNITLYKGVVVKEEDLPKDGVEWGDIYIVQTPFPQKWIYMNDGWRHAPPMDPDDA